LGLMGQLGDWFIEVAMDCSLSEELTMVRDMAREFVTNELMPIEREVLVRDGQAGNVRGAPIPREQYVALRNKAVDQGLWAMTAPEELGGGGLNALGACLVAEELGKTFVDFDFGDIPPILFDANFEQRTRYLKPAIAGNIGIALAIREPDSDDIRARATRDGDAWIMNGTKLANDADVYLVFVQTEDRISCFIVEGLMNQDGKVKLENTRVLDKNVLGEVGGALVLGKTYCFARMTRAAARQVGIAMRLLEMSSQYARDWKALGQPLAVRPAVQHNLADMAIEIDAARCLVHLAACEIDEGKGARGAATRAYLFALEMVQRAIDRTIEIYGGPAHAVDVPTRLIYGARRNAEPAMERQRLQIANELVAA
jgi:acyl-CoA dehydrogenase